MMSKHASFAVLSTLLGVRAALGGTDVQVNSDPPAMSSPPGDVQNEPRLALDPNNSNNVIVAYNDDIGMFPNSLGVSFSSDGGATWSDGQLTTPMIPDPSPMSPPGSMITLDDVFDPFAAYDALGNAYAGYIGRPSTGTPGTNPPSGLFIERSTDGGLTWSGPTTIATDPGGPFAGPLVAPMSAPLFNDRPEIDSGGNGEVVVTWIKDVDVNTPTSDIYFTESLAPAGPPTPGLPNPTGLTFSTPVIVNDNSQWLNPMTGTDRGIAPDVAIHANGNIYVAWADYDVTVTDATSGAIMIDSTAFGAGGTTFSNDITVASIDPLPKHVSTGTGTADDARAQSYPSIAVDPTDSSGQTVYLTFAEEDTSTGDEGNIFFTMSTTGGAAGTWSTPKQINDDVTNHDQMHPNIAVKPDGTIDIVWYDKRNAVNDDAWDVYIARSTDGGLTFSANLRVTDTTFNTPTRADAAEPWLGEYLGIDTDSSDAFVAFTSGVNDTFGDVFFDKIPNASIPEPTTCVIWLVLSGMLCVGRSSGAFALQTQNPGSGFGLLKDSKHRRHRSRLTHRKDMAGALATGSLIGE